MLNKRIVTNDIEEVIKDLGEKIFQLENKNILITGASGMISSYIICTIIYANENLFLRPATLYLISRRTSRKFGMKKYIKYIKADISKKIPKLSDIDFIIHAASKAAPKDYMKQMVDTLNSNILGLYNLIDLNTGNLKSFLYLSSGEVYGDPESEKKISENYIGRVDNLNKRSCYVEGKRAGETICMNYFWEKRLPVKIARIFHTFGPGLNINDGRVFSDFIKNGLDRKNIKIMGDSTLKRPLLYLKDATVMLFLLLLSDNNGEVYNIGNSRNLISVGQFADTVCKEFNRYYTRKLKVELGYLVKTDHFKHAVKSIRPDISKFEKDFTYSPKTSIRKAVSKTVAYYLEQ